jgi:hypothetical protein
MSTFYPMAGAVVGGGAGSIGGPAMGAVGAGAGYAMGELAKGEDTAQEIKQVKDQVEALSQGDIQKLVELRLEENNEGFFDVIMAEVWGIAKLLALGTLLYILIPIIYTRYLHKKTDAKLKEK